MKFLFFIFIFISNISAHPHTFIEVHPTLHVENSKFSTIKFKWVLDDMTSTILIMELDTNANGVIDKIENDYIEKEYFSMFKDYSYYTYIKVNKKSTPPLSPKNFKATIENNKLCYSFEIQGEYDVKNTYIEFGDSDYYVAMVLKKEFVHVKGAEVIVKGVDNDFYYGYSLGFK